MLSSKILGSVTKRKSFMNPTYNPTLLSNLMQISSDTHMSTGVDAVESNHRVTSKSRVNDLADGKCRYAGKLSPFKSQMLVHQPHVVGTLSPHKYMSNCHYSTHYADSSTINSQHKLLGNIPRYVKIVEVGPRDGLQNEKDIVPTAVKVELIKMLVDSGLEVVEATSFVSPKWVPQLADAKDVIEATKRIGGARFPVLTPNLKGLEAALAAGVKEVAVFAAASESFSRSNINCSIDESLSRYRDVASAAEKHSIPVRGYISCVVGCPMEGAVHPSKVAYVAEELVKLGCAEISLGDTIGVGTPGTVIPMIEAVKNVVPIEKLAVHFHDTYGQALSNILISLQTGPARQLMVRPLSQTCQLREKKQLFIDELEVGVSGTIVVMLCRKWDVNAKTGRYLSTDFIVSDGKGNIMHCTSNATVSHNFVGKLHNGMIYSIKDFTVIQNKEEYRVIKDAQYMIEFDWSTTVRKAVIKADGFVRHPFQLVPFESIEPTDNKFMIDVVGYITNVGRLTYQKTGSRNLDFYLANQSGQSIR